MTRTTRFLLLTLLLAPLAAAAQSDDPQALPAWEQLTPAQRDELVAPLRERWDAKPAERARMLERARRWKAMTPEQRARARHGMARWEHMPPRQRAEARALFHAMRGMAPEQRKAFLAEWRQKTPEQRQAWLEAHPAPPRRPRAD